MSINTSHPPQYLCSKSLAIPRESIDPIRQDEVPCQICLCRTYKTIDKVVDVRALGYCRTPSLLKPSHASEISSERTTDSFLL